jgi:hypothetical protein
MRKQLDSQLSDLSGEFRIYARDPPVAKQDRETFGTSVQSPIELQHSDISTE